MLTITTRIRNKTTRNQSLLDRIRSEFYLRKSNQSEFFIQKFKVIVNWFPLVYYYYTKYIESNTDKSPRQGNLTRGCRRFPCLALFAVFDFISHFYPYLVSCLFVNSASCKQCELFPLNVNQNSSSVFLCIA